MKLPDFTDDPELNELRTKMGALAPGHFILTFQPKGLTQEELNQLAAGGIEVSFEEITRLDDGTLGYKDSRVLVYIRDVPTYGGDFNLPRFHFSYCRTLEQMHAAHRIERYVVATRESGEFWIQKIESGRKLDGSWEKLNVCQNCLAALGFDNFSLSLKKKRRMEIVAAFSITSFFEKYPKSLHSHRPQYDYITAPTNNYTQDFDQISKRIRAIRGNKCEECGLNPDGHFLDVHHINGQKNDNREENLLVLCRGCHASMPYHGKMKATPGFKDFQRKYNPNR